jgi:ParB family chromosome partitioning protein
MAVANWRPAVDNYLGRVPKVRILEPMREAKSQQSAQLIDYLKKADMAKEAERLLDGAGWLPESLCPSQIYTAASAPTGEAAALPDFLAEDEDDAQAEIEEEQPHMVAAQ